MRGQDMETVSKGLLIAVGEGLALGIPEGSRVLRAALGDQNKWLS